MESSENDVGEAVCMADATAVYKHHIAFLVRELPSQFSCEVSLIRDAPRHSGRPKPLATGFETPALLLMSDRKLAG